MHLLLTLRFVMRPCPPLHRQILCQIRIVPGALYFVGVAVVALVGLDPLARLEEVTQNIVGNFNVGILTGRV
jgi:hypothetical protein